MPANRQEVVEFILQHRVSAIVRTDSQDIATRAMDAAIVGGFRVVEFTLTTPGAIELIQTFGMDERILVGAGTVLSVEQARQAVGAGARFLVSPVCDPVVIEEAGRLGAACIPGTFTATEMQTAHNAGADFVKLFPAPGNVVEYVRSLRGPLPHLRIFPTAGFSVDDFVDVLKAGAAGVGFVRPLFEPADLKAGNFSAVEERARKIVASLPAMN